MEKHEVRIGNYVEVKDWLDRKKWHQIPVVSILPEGINPQSWGQGHEPTANSWKDVRGISLTEDLLRKLGFQKDEVHNCFVLIQTESGVAFEYFDEAVHYVGASSAEAIEHIKFVHQLQNLYFALTGKELQWKQTT